MSITQRIQLQQSRFKLFLITALFSLFSVRPSFSQDENDIFTRHLKAVLGQKKLEDVKTIYLSGTYYESVMDKTTQFRIYKKTPNLIRYERIENGDTTYICFDGLVYHLGSKPERYTISMLSKMKSSTRKTLPPTENIIIDYIDVVAQAKLLTGIQTDTGKVYELIYTKDAIEKNFYIDEKELLLRKQVVIDKENATKTTSNYQNYKTIQGITLPMTVKIETIAQGNFQMTSEYHYETIDINVEINDEIFDCK